MRLPSWLRKSSSGIWLPNAVVAPSLTRQGGSYANGAPWRFVGHTIEGVPSDANGLISLARNHPNPPHLWLWPAQGLVVQTLPLDVSAYALAHPAGTPDTNRMGAIQAEVVGYAADTQDWPWMWWAWIGTVIASIVQAGVPLNLDHVAPVAGPEGSGVNGAVRMTREAWAAFDGLCDHANVPDNDHWDWGRGNPTLVAAAARSILQPPTPPPPAPSFKEYKNVDLRVHTVSMTLGPDGKGWNLTPDALASPVYETKLNGRYEAIGSPNTYLQDVKTFRAFVQGGHVEIVVEEGRPNAVVTFEVHEKIGA